MMARFYRRGLRPVVFTIKHVIDGSATATAGTAVTNVLYDAVQTPVLTTPVQVAIGGKVSSVYLNVEVASNETDAGAIPNVYMIIFKNPADNLAPPDPASVGTSDVKRFVIHQEMTMIQNVAGGNPRKLFVGVIRIPKHMQRLGNDDKLQLTIKSTAVNITFCFQCIFKEQR